MTISARELSALLTDLLRRERFALAEFLVALASFDRERRWLELGYASLFDYLHRDLGLSKGAAFYRMTAARLIQEHPPVVEPLRDGRICLTSIAELARVLTVENRDQVLPRFFHLSKREAKLAAAELRPAEVIPARTVVVPVRAPSQAKGGPAPFATPALSFVEAPTSSSALVAPSPKVAASDHGQSVHPANQDSVSGLGHASIAPSSAPACAPAIVEKPLSADLSRVHLTVSRRLLAKLEAARAALSHSNPGASEAEILEVGLDLIIERHAKRRGIVKNPRKVTPAAPRQARGERMGEHDSAAGEGAGVEVTVGVGVALKREYIPAHVKRAVWLRDGGKCQWPVEGGGICGSTTRVQIDHIVPPSRGGGSTADDLRCLCAPTTSPHAGCTGMSSWTGSRRVAAEASSHVPEPQATQTRRATGLASA